ncbi:MAG: nicotinate-nucleotide adenylyltransferase [Firmicutes bacterium]|nr:nicotinate-nucleotide adenylyltransferase [Bacillota bacterium]
MKFLEEHVPLPLPPNLKPGPVNIGLMGGTFDPVHIGHLVSAEEARQQFSLDYVVFIPAGLPPHKEKEQVSPAEHRYLMTTLAVMSNPSFVVSRVEVDKDEPTYTIDTLSHFTDSCAPGTNFFFITGADAIMEILTWKDYFKLIRLCTFIAVSRPEFPLERLGETTAKLSLELRTKIHLLEIPALAISSTFIRKRVALGKTIKYLTPEPVEQYIKKHGLYKK